MTRVSPSILSADFSRLGEEVARVSASGADWIHLDVMDGMFVPNLTFGPPVIGAVRRYSDLPFDTHLMIEDPVRYVDAFADAGCDSITVHLEADGDIAAALQRVRRRGLRAGISMNPETPFENVVQWLPVVDLLLVMTVHPGFGGQSFIADCLGKISEAREWADRNRPSLNISVDGGINDDTARDCVDAGADVLVAGSYLFGREDMSATIRSWQALGPNAGRSHGS